MEIKLTCKECSGACCKSFIISHAGLTPDLIKYVNLHGVVGFNYTRILAECSNLINGKCSDYENRPDTCKDFQVGGVSCLEQRAKFNQI